MPFDMKNVTVTVAALFECETLNEHLKTISTYDPVWRQTVTGCKILKLLRDMYKFNVSYVFDNVPRNFTLNKELLNAPRRTNLRPDVYARSMSLSDDLLDNVYPVLAVNTWRFGFLLSKTNNEFFTTFYSKPFSRPVWNCLYAMAILVSLIFYILKRWEFSILGGWQTSYAYESLMIIGAYCQHIPPIDPKLPSRRVAYFIFFVFAYIVYTFYTSNLLSNLVNDKGHDIGLDTLAESDYECVIVDYMKLALVERLYIMEAPTTKRPRAPSMDTGSMHNYFQINNRNISIVLGKLANLKSVTVAEGLDAVKKGHVAILSDYTTIYPYIRRTYDNDDICKLVSIHLASQIKKYFYTSKDFKYKEQFKVGTLRIKEVGILTRIVSTNFEEPKCEKSHLVQIRLSQISIPLTLLACVYVVSLLILVAERIHYKRNVVWRYVD